MRKTGIFAKKEIREAGENVLNESSLDTALRAALGGQVVTVQNALNIPALSGAVEFIAGTVASLPVRLYHFNPPTPCGVGQQT